MIKTNFFLQIEQFIESIFPSQKPPLDNKSPASVEEAERKKKEDNEAKWDLIYMMTAVGLTVGVITFFMVCFHCHLSLGSADLLKLFIAWMAGARFDIAWTQLKQQLGQLLGYSTGPVEIADIHVPVAHKEL